MDIEPFYIKLILVLIIKSIFNIFNIFRFMSQIGGVYLKEKWLRQMNLLGFDQKCVEMFLQVKTKIRFILVITHIHFNLV